MWKERNANLSLEDIAHEEAAVYTLTNGKIICESNDVGGIETYGGGRYLY